MNDLFKNFLDDFMIIYLDDDLILWKNQKEHEKHACFVFNKFWRKKVVC
jgi:hypothetical protein